MPNEPEVAVVEVRTPKEFVVDLLRESIARSRRKPTDHEIDVFGSRVLAFLEQAFSNGLLVEEDFESAGAGSPRDPHHSPLHDGLSLLIHRAKVRAAQREEELAPFLADAEEAFQEIERLGLGREPFSRDAFIGMIAAEHIAADPDFYTTPEQAALTRKVSRLVDEILASSLLREGDLDDVMTLAFSGEPIKALRLLEKRRRDQAANFDLRQWIAGLARETVSHRIARGDYGDFPCGGVLLTAAQVANLERADEVAALRWIEEKMLAGDLIDGDLADAIGIARVSTSTAGFQELADRALRRMALRQQSA